MLHLALQMQETRELEDKVRVMQAKARALEQQVEGQAQRIKFEEMVQKVEAAQREAAERTKGGTGPGYWGIG